MSESFSLPNCVIISPKITDSVNFLEPTFIIDLFTWADDVLFKEISKIINTGNKFFKMNSFYFSMKLRWALINFVTNGSFGDSINSFTGPI